MSPELLMRNTRQISWISQARRDFEEFPADVQSDMLDALTLAAEGGKADKAKPLKGLTGGVFEIAIKYRKAPAKAGAISRCKSGPGKV
jgi:phage-related protein